MKIGIKILVLLVCVPLIVLGSKAMFFPTSTFELFDIKPIGIYGLNTIRADIGGILLGSALMILVGVFKNNPTWFLSTILIMSVVLVGRIISIVADGWTSATIPALVVETVVITVLYLAYSKSINSK
jgi:hypothetical protein